MSSFDVGTAFVRVIPVDPGFASLLQAQVNRAVSQVKVPPLAATAAVETERAGAAASAAAVQQGALAAATGTATAASVEHSAASAAEASSSLAVTRALEAQRLAEQRLAIAVAAGANAATLQTLQNKVLIASEAARVSQLRATEKAIGGLGTRAQVLQGSLVGLTRITPVAVFGLNVYGTAAIAAGLALTAAVHSAADFEQQMNTVQAVSRATGEQMQRLSDLAQQLGNDVTLPGQSALDAAQAMTTLAKAGLSVNDTFAATEGVLRLATAASISAGEAAGIAATQLNAFKLSGDQTTRVAELLADASIAAQGEITDFSAAFQQAAAAAQQSGVSIEDTTGLLTELAKAGIQGADAGTSLRTFLLRLVPTTKEATEFTEALGINLDKTATIGEQLSSVIEQYRVQLEKLNPQQQTLVLNQIFGQDAFRAASVIFGQQKDALKALTDEFARSNSLQDLTAAKTKGLKGSFANLQSQTETLGLEIGDFVKGPLKDIVDGITGIVGATSAAIGGLEDLKDVLENFKPVGDTKILDFLGFDVSGADVIRKGVDFVKDARENVREEIARQDRIDSLRKGGVFGISLIATPGAFGVDEDVQAATKAAAAAPLTAAIKARRKTIEDAINDASADLTIPIPKAIRRDLVEAQLSGSNQALLEVDNAIVDFLAKRLTTINKNTEKYIQVAGQLVDAQNARDQVIAAIKAAAEKAQMDFVLPTGLTIAQIQAGSTKSLNDNLAADRAIVSAYQKQLANTKATGDALNQLRVQLAQAQAQVVADEQAIADATEQAGKERLAAREHLAETIRDIQDQRISNRIAAALATPGISDDRRAFLAQMAIFEGRKKEALAALKAAKDGSQTQKDAQLEIAKLNGDIAKTRRDIAGLGKDGGGLTLAELFQESVKTLQDFGSNVASSITTAAGARASLAGGILSQKDVLTKGERLQIDEASSTNDLLRQILDTLRVGGQIPSQSREPAADLISAFGGPAGLATTIQARRLLGLTG